MLGYFLSSTLHAPGRVSVSADSPLPIALLETILLSLEVILDWANFPESRVPVVAASSLYPLGVRTLTVDTCESSFSPFADFRLYFDFDVYFRPAGMTTTATQARNPISMSFETLADALYMRQERDSRVIEVVLAIRLSTQALQRMKTAQVDVKKSYKCFSGIRLHVPWNVFPISELIIGIVAPVVRHRPRLLLPAIKSSASTTTRYLRHPHQDLPAPRSPLPAPPRGEHAVLATVGTLDTVSLNQAGALHAGRSTFRLQSLGEAADGEGRRVHEPCDHDAPGEDNGLRRRTPVVAAACGGMRRASRAGAGQGSGRSPEQFSTSKSGHKTQTMT
ncbi:hypothetical protein EVG20_g2263 [Dentipellis fragilis]|uniref:Uncharacterized protein n=1 Tax=Dentipellis fragilis TaxID=205917 RepID=A0A4Y9Z9N7_9AGAM|nr:hypothetical protein EVG20_g2263 [Dentipellis fragilis]